MYETQLYLSYTHQQRVLHVLEHCKFLYSELEKKIANEQEERITLEKIQFQCSTQLSLPHGRFWGIRITPNSGCVRLGNLDLDFKIRISDLQSNAKSEKRFQR